MLGDEALVNLHLRKLARRFIPLDGVSLDRVELDFAGKVPGQVDEMS
jgi:hypothetical protein